MMAAMKTTTYHPAPKVYWTPAPQDRAWHTEHGRRKRVVVIEGPVWSNRDGRDICLCAFIDEQMARFEVPASELSPADAAWERVPVLVALRNTRAVMGGRTVDQPLAQRARAQPVADNDEPDISTVRVARNRLTETQREVLDEAERLGASTKPADQSRARGLIRDIFLAVAASAVRIDRTRRAAEIKVLEEGRSGEVSTTPAGALRVDSRTGLRKAFEDGQLDGSANNIRAEMLYAIGKRYRDCYEAAEGRTSPERDPGVPAAKRYRPGAGPQDHVLAAANDLAQMRGTKLRGNKGAGFRLTRLQRRVLDAICGEDRSLTAAADQLRRSRADTRTALVEGLETAGANMGWWE